MKPKILDTFCKAGGCSVGYSLAGFDVVGVDIEPQPHYPFPFILGDALDVLRRMIAGEKFTASDGIEYGLDDFDVFHASPVCKGYSVMSSLWKNKEYPDQVGETREVLQATGKPYVIENVVGAPLKNYVMLCGSMFGLRVYRHRLFECNPPLYFPPMSCNHWAKASGNRAMRNGKHVVDSLADYKILTVTGKGFKVSDGRIAMGIDWMTGAELSQAIPPAYTHWLGTQVITRLTPREHRQGDSSPKAGLSLPAHLSV